MMKTRLDKIAQVAKAKPKERFTSLYHLMNEEMFMECHKEMSGRKATGVDGVTKQEYEVNRDENLKELVLKLKRFSYKPQPALRVHIPKDSGGTRPLGISAYEDKLVQMGLRRILNAIYEQDFYDFSYGFRPKRSNHDALKAVNKAIEWKKTNYIVDVDIKGFFNHVEHNWLIKFLEHRIADPNIIRLIKRLLKAGIIENGRYYKTDEGTPQGSVISPILANIYLHYVLDIWFEKKVKKYSRGEAGMIRYADDFVCCFQYESDAEKFYRALKQRLNKFGLSIAEDKSQIIEFGRFADSNNQKRGKKTATFDFLGFTHYCGKSKKGKFRVKRKTSKKKLRKKIAEFKQWIKASRNKLVMKDIFEIVKTKLLGHYRYYGITDNTIMIKYYFYEVKQMLFKWLNRRSQRKSFDWNNFNKYLKLNPLPHPKIYVNIYS